MNREIKFRTAYFNLDGSFYDYMYWGIDQYGSVDEMPRVVGCKRGETFQYTGLKDKNGVEIYEGDLVDNGTGEYVGVITFKNGCFLHRNSPMGYFVEDGVVEDNRSCPDDEITLQEGATHLWAVVIGKISSLYELLGKEVSHD